MRESYTSPGKVPSGSVQGVVWRRSHTEVIYCMEGLPEIKKKKKKTQQLGNGYLSKKVTYK